MSNSAGSGPNPNQRNYQTNRADNGGTIYANQGGSQEINHVTHNTNKAARSFAGWALLVCVVVDVIFFFYGMTAYTGQPGNSGDLWRAGIFLALLATTGTLIRRWLRRRL